MSRGELAQGRRAGNLECGGKRSAAPLSLACRRADQCAVALRLPAQSKAGLGRHAVVRRVNDKREFTGELTAGSERSLRSITS